ncbi:MAG: M4 family metallopeptidase [Saprospiraceae bacterium]|nr:M4 family metallopeptidase [Saprospiraceae bacterium]
MKRLFLLLPLLSIAVLGLAQKPLKNKNIQAVPHNAPQQPINVPELGVPIATQPLVSAPAIQRIPYLPKRSALLPTGLKVKTSEMGLPTMIEGTLPTPQYATQKSVEERTNQYLTAIAKAIQIQNPSDEFVIKSIETDNIGQTHVRLSQVFKQIPVWSSEIIVHEQNDKVFLFNGIYFPTPSVNSTTPAVQATQAEATVQSDLDKKVGFKKLAETAKEQIGGEQLRSELVIFHKNDKYDAERLTWHITAYPSVVHRYEYFVDAQTGEILDSYHSSCSFAGHIHGVNETAETPQHTEGVHNETAQTTVLDGAFTATALDLLNTSRTINTYQVGTRYYMLDASRPMYSAASSTMPNKPIGVIQTLDYNNTDDGPYYYITTTNNSWSNPKAVSSHYNGGRAYEYFRTTFNRNSINGRGGTISSFINVTDGGQSMDNAYWNGEAMFYGNGSQAFLPLARGLDVAGHEMSHGVIQNTANLKYQSEPGALNESFADIFGAMIDRDDWQIGEDVVNGRSIFPTGFLRDLANPNNGGTGLSSNGWQPKHMNEKYNGTSDNGGVHINSGITNYAFYLFANNSSVGKATAEQVFYRALSTYLVASSKFIDCRAAVEQSCKDLYPTSAAILSAAQTAFTSVGIGTGGSTSGTVYQQDLPVNPGTDWVVYVSNDRSKLQLTNSTGSSVQTLSSRGVFNKPSISDNGKYIFYIGADKKMYLVTMNWATTPPTASDAVIQSDPIWNNVAVSKDGTKIAANDGTDTLWLYSFARSTWKAYKLFNPTFSSGVDAGAVQYSDGLEWDHFGTSVMYDAFNSIKGQTTNQNIEYWDVGSIDVWSNTTNNWLTTPKIEKLFTDLPENTSIGNPTFAKNSPYIVAFDFIDDSGTNSAYYIMAANTQTGDVTAASTGIFANNTLGYPSYSKTDNRILFSNEDNSGASRLGIIPVSGSKIEPNGTATVFKTDAIFGVWIATGTRVLTSVGDLDKAAVAIAPNPFGDNVTVSVTYETAATGKVEIFDLLGRLVSTTPLSISAGQNTVSLDTHTLQAGNYLLKVTIDDKSRTNKIVKF